MHLFLSHKENTVLSREYTGPLGFDITGVECTCRLSIYRASYTLPTNV